LGFPVGDPEFADGYVVAGTEPVEETEGVSATNRYFVVLDEPPLAQYRGGIPGLAPMAWVFHYYNMDGTPGMVKAYEVMIEDKIDAVNLSRGHVGWLIDRPETHPIT